MTSEASEATVENIEDEGPENPKEAGFVRLNPVAFGRGLEEAALNNLENGHETAEEISSGHDTGKKISHAAAGGEGWLGF